MVNLWFDVFLQIQLPEVSRNACNEIACNYLSLHGVFFYFFYFLFLKDLLKNDGENYPVDFQ